MPWPSTSATNGCSISHAVSAGPSVAAAITSTSPTDSARRRSEPASSARSQAGMRAQRLEHRARELERLVEAEHALARRRACLELGEQLLLLALAEAGLALQAALARGGLELRERRDAELLPEPARGLRAQAREADDLDEALGDAPAQLLERRHRARLAQLADLRRDRVADVVELGQPALLGQRPDRLGGLAKALGGPAVGEHAVHDGAVQLVEIAEQVEEIGDLAIAQGHAEDRSCRCMRRIPARMRRRADPLSDLPAHLRRAREPRAHGRGARRRARVRTTRAARCS